MYRTPGCEDGEGGNKREGRRGWRGREETRGREGEGGGRGREEVHVDMLWQEARTA